MNNDKRRIALLEKIEKLESDGEDHTYQVWALRDELLEMRTPEEVKADDAYEIMNFNQDMTNEFNNQ